MSDNKTVCFIDSETILVPFDLQYATTLKKKDKSIKSPIILSVDFILDNRFKFLSLPNGQNNGQQKKYFIKDMSQSDKVLFVVQCRTGAFLDSVLRYYPFTYANKGRSIRDAYQKQKTEILTSVVLNNPSDLNITYTQYTTYNITSILREANSLPLLYTWFKDNVINDAKDSIKNSIREYTFPMYSRGRNFDTRNIKYANIIPQQELQETMESAIQETLGYIETFRTKFEEAIIH